MSDSAKKLRSKSDLFFLSLSAAETVTRKHFHPERNAHRKMHHLNILLHIHVIKLLIMYERLKRKNSKNVNGSYIII